MDRQTPTQNSHIVFAQRRSQKYPITQATPHLRTHNNTRKIMGNVLIALLPAIVGSLYFFGPVVLVYYVVSIAGALAIDFAAQLVRYRRIKKFDLSAVVTGTLVAMSLPANVPFWYGALGAGFGILVAKELFGGIGQNFLNPALLGRALPRLLFAGPMTQNPMPNPPFNLGTNPDAIASATPLMVLKEGHPLSGQQLLNAFTGYTGGKLGETSAMLLLIGAVYMVVRGIIKLRIPGAALGTIVLMAFVMGGPNGLFTGGLDVITGHLLGGATMLGVFYMLTDYGSSPSAPAAQYIYGILCGISIMLFRFYSPWSEGFTFAILIANFTVPLLNRLIRPRVLGEKRRWEKEKSAS